MNANRPKAKKSAAFEYFLYVAIILETGLAAFVYKTTFRDPDLIHLNLYFGIFYVAFLGWSIFQLNKLHRRRKLALSEPIPEIADSVPELDPSKRGTNLALGLTTPQLVIVVLVFASAVATFSWALRLLR
jgi:hypothetical protein